MKKRILIVEDDKTISKFINISLKSQGYECIVAESGKEAMSLFFSQNPDIIILDLGLPDMDGEKVIEELRSTTDRPIIVVSARDTEKEKVKILDKGADDYLTKPFSLAELLARVRVSLRHLNKNSNIGQIREYYQVGDLRVDIRLYKVFVKGEEIHFTPIEFKLIEYMCLNAGKVLTHKDILENVWGAQCDYDSNSLRVFMASIRRKIEEDRTRPKYILTEVGIGYRLVDQIS